MTPDDVITFHRGDPVVAHFFRSDADPYPRPHAARFWDFAVPGALNRVVVEDQSGHLHWCDTAKVSLVAEVAS